MALRAIRHHGDPQNIVKAECVRWSFARLDGDVRGDADFGEINGFEQRLQTRIGDKHFWCGFERGADTFLRPLDFQGAGDDRTDAADFIPFFRQCVIAPR